MNELLRKRDLAKFLNVSVNTLNLWMRIKKIPFLKLGGGEKASVRFDPEEVEKWLRKGTGHESKAKLEKV
jgi:excisionase family DNA binding protein